MNSVTLETEYVPETTDVEHTLESQSTTTLIHPRLSFSSITSLGSQTSLPIQENGDDEINPIKNVEFSEIESKEEELKELYTEEELYTTLCNLRHRNQLKDVFYVSTSKSCRVQMEDPTPYLYKESSRLPIPPIPTVECSRIDRDRLNERQVILEQLNRPYHPLLYTSFHTQE